VAHSSSVWRVALGGVLFLLVWGAPRASQAKVLRGATPEERKEFFWLKHALGYVWCQDARVLFTKPYKREALERLVAKACDPGGSVPGRTFFVGMLTQVIQFAEAPTEHLEKVARPALERALRAAEEHEKRAPDDAQAVRLAAETRRCWWNLRYALATAQIKKLEKEGKDPSNAPAKRELESLEKEAMDRLRSARVDWVGDLVTWWLRSKLETATAKISELAKVKKHNWRVRLAHEELRLRRQLKKSKDDDQRVSVLIEASADPDNPIPLQGWAVRTLSEYPTEAAIKFLFELHRTARDKKRDDLGLEAQEALRRLKKIPEADRRYRLLNRARGPCRGYAADRTKSVREAPEPRCRIPRYIRAPNVDEQTRARGQRASRRSSPMPLTSPTTTRSEE